VHPEYTTAFGVEVSIVRCAKDRSGAKTDTKVLSSMGNKVEGGFREQVKGIYVHENVGNNRRRRRRTEE
jgi:hypothetical protein